MARKDAGLGLKVVAAAAAVAMAHGVPVAVAAPGSEGDQTLEGASMPRCPARHTGIEAGAASFLKLGCDGLDGHRVEIARRPRHGDLGVVDQDRERVRYRPDRRYRGRDHIVVERERNGQIFRTSVRIAIGEEDPRHCTDKHAVARAESPVEIRIRCTGEDLRKLSLVDSAFSGEVDRIRRSSSSGGDVRVLTARYTPEPGFSGQDTLLVDATAGDRASHGSIGVSVLPWRMRAMGDSVTAGFGFMGDGTPMQLTQLFDCRPPDNLNNRCSSNSDNGPKYTGPPGWSKDYGLENRISWAAQFANSIDPGDYKVSSPGVFQNLAVTGSAPTDWLPGGPFSDQLKSIIADDPELIPMTLGANPLLSTILFGDGVGCASRSTVADLQDCIRPFFEKVDLAGNLQRVYTALLKGTTSAKVVVFQYPLSDPWLTNFSNWQVEAMINFFNDQIATAVETTKRALPDEASRLIPIQAQIEPGSPDPQLVPRFHIGVPPVGQQTWTATHDCGTGQLVDGTSHQSTDTQNSLKNTPGFCAGDPWVITTDGGIHPNADGYTQMATTLTNVLGPRGLLPPG